MGTQRETLDKVKELAARFGATPEMVDDTMAAQSIDIEKTHTPDMRTASYYEFLRELVPAGSSLLPWLILKPETQASLVERMRAILSSTRQFEHHLAQLTIEMVRARTAYLAALRKLPEGDMERVQWRRETDAVERKMLDAVDRVNSLVLAFERRQKPDHADQPEG